MKNFVQAGDNLPILSSACVGPNTPPKSGDPVVVGTLVGVVNADSAGASDTIVISTRGVYTISVAGINAGGNVAVALGDQLYIDPATGAVNKKVANVPFGTALAAVTSGTTAAIPVKLHSV